jgi:alpha-tubulin suppressor-like RCC1 family protein
MSTINVTNLSGRGGATPNLPDGANITGVATATTFSGTLDGSLKSTGTPTLGLGVTINASGISVSGVLTATTFKGDGSNLTGVGETIAPWHYNPDVNDSSVGTNTGIGITFNKKIVAGSGTATLKIVNAGVAGTTIQSWGISSATYNTTEFSLNSLVSSLVVNQTYQVDIPGPFIVDSVGTNYAGTAYTFATKPAQKKLWVWGHNSEGQLGLNDLSYRSSPTQVPGFWGDSYGALGEGYLRNATMAVVVKNDGTLWSWGSTNSGGQLGQNDINKRSSPAQIGSGTDWKQTSQSYLGAIATKTDGTLWAWGGNDYGQLGQNSRNTPGNAGYSSPTQIPGTTWSHAQGGYYYNMGLKTDGTLWGWGSNTYGVLGQNDRVTYSSPVQIPGTTWTNKIACAYTTYAVKTDGTLWAFGSNTYGALGLNQPHPTKRSSPVQIPGTTWSTIGSSWAGNTFALKTDNTAWVWGDARKGSLGQNNLVQRSSPVQLPGTWSKIGPAEYGGGGIKSDGTMWVWGLNHAGQLGQNDKTERSSPIQIPGTEWTNMVGIGPGEFMAIQDDQTP